MIYESFQLNYEKLVIEASGIAAGNHKFVTVSDTCDEIRYMIDVCSFTLPSLFVDVLSRTNFILIELKEHYRKKNHNLEEVYISQVKDVEFFNILEIIYNYIVPLSIKYILNPNISDEYFDNDITTGLIAAEARISICYSKIIREETTKGEISLYNFHNFDFKNSYLLNTETTVPNEISPKKKIKKESVAQTNRQNKTPPASYKDLIINPLQPKEK